MKEEDKSLIVRLSGSGLDKFDPTRQNELISRGIAAIESGALQALPQKRITWPKDSSEMVLIPAGSFEMCDHFDEGDNDELPVHIVELDPFYMDAYQVTVGQFKQFVEDSGYDYDNWDDVADKYSPTNQHPMISVSWNNAFAYTEWVGKRLPTEAEWEYAARGGLAGKRYPWGDEDPTADKANYDWSVGKTSPVGSYVANGYGLYDMAGNIWEWCADRYDREYYKNSPAKNPLGPETGSYRVLRGGSWINTPYTLRVAYRGNNPPYRRRSNHGFRCVSGLNFEMDTVTADADQSADHLS